MDKKEFIIAGIVVIIAVMATGIIFAPGIDAKHTTIDVLNKGDYGQNSTIYVKLTDHDKAPLSDKTVHIKLTNDKNEVVYDESTKTHATGVAIAQLDNITAGKYTLNVTFDGDGNHSGSSISQEITVKEGYVEDTLENTTLIQETIASSQSSSSSGYSSSSSYYSSQGSSSSQSSSSSSSSSQGSSSSQSSSSSSSSVPDTYIDTSGNEYLPEYDEYGNRVN